MGVGRLCTPPGRSEGEGRTNESRGPCETRPGDTPGPPAAPLPADAPGDSPTAAALLKGV